MGITIMGGSTKENDMFIAALQGKPISYDHPDSLNQMMSIMTIVSSLSKEQREDFLILNQQGHCVFPEGSDTTGYKDIWTFLAQKTSFEFKEYYKFCSKRREINRGVRAIIVKTN